MPLTLFLNASPTPSKTIAPSNRQITFHRKLPSYQPTPLLNVPQLAARLGLAHVFVKQETCRMGMPAFKIMGASWATYCALERLLGTQLEGWQRIEELRSALLPLQPLTLVAATDGNHGRAVARMAALLGCAARIYVPTGTSSDRIQAITSEAAQVIVVDGSYDDAVRLSASQEGPGTLVISDTAWEGYTRVPQDVIAGYDTIFAEADTQFDQLVAPTPDLIMVQIGVGALAAAVLRHYGNRQPRPIIVGVEPDTAACALAALQAGQIVEVPGPHPSIMAGLNAGLVSPVAWPDLKAGLNASMAIPDATAAEAMRLLAHEGITAGETGAAGLAGLLALMTSPQAQAARTALGLGQHTTALVIITEGATDAANYTRIVGRPPALNCPTPGTCTCKTTMPG